jgi:hypothetical protein
MIITNTMPICIPFNVYLITYRETPYLYHRSFPYGILKNCYSGILSLFRNQGHVEYE